MNPSRTDYVTTSKPSTNCIHILRYILQYGIGHKYTGISPIFFFIFRIFGGLNSIDLAGLTASRLNSIDAVHKLWSMLCLPMSGAEAAFSHGQTRHSTCTCKLNSTIYMAFHLCYHPCHMHELWSILCLPMSSAETASSHGQTQHSTSYL